jgi:hypothetical protein
MKIRHLLFCFIVIIAVSCSPALAISKGELISFDKGQSVPETPAQIF